jgi:hypothetical protein
MYDQGADAANRLAVTGKPIEVCLEIPQALLRFPSPVRRVLPFHGADGAVEREGLGTEFTVHDEISVRDLRWRALAAP